MDFKTSNEETKTGVYLLQDGNEEPFNIRLHLAKDILTIQEQDVICVSGEPFYSSVSNLPCLSNKIPRIDIILLFYRHSKRLGPALTACVGM
uniref:Syntrophin gamma 1 n=1 Tax=Hucho hucho TaxID=62062 RepID=A0A4W5N6V8_9TELE